VVLVDRSKCCFCGGCVSVCPVQALDLAENYLVVDAACSECGLCLASCPVGALRLESQDWPRAPRARLAARYDVIVVGAGPAGSVAAWTAAQRGLSVLLIEKRQEIGVPVRCAEGIAEQGLTPFVEPDERWISAKVDTAVVTAIGPDGREELRAEGGQGYILERRVFDRMLAERAVAAGAQVAVKTPACGLLWHNGAASGVTIGAQGDSQDIAAKVVIAADGVESQVGRWAGLDTWLALQDTMACAQYLMAGVDTDPACCAYFIGEAIAPGGYAWIFPKGAGLANVGLGVAGDRAQQGQTALELLHRFIEDQPGLACGSPVALVAGGVPVTLPPRCLVTDGLMLVGDAARQVDPLIGGGIAHAMSAGRSAAQVAAAAIAAADVSRQALMRYEDEWAAGLGRKMARNYRWRQRFPAAQRAGRDFLRVFAAAAAG
jgi:digeranylgeranylglycerophospholipid reductase